MVLLNVGGVPMIVSSEKPLFCKLFFGLVSRWQAF